MLPPRDADLVQITDAALADATARARRPDGSSWLACRPGCTPCCHGVFRITALDAARLQAALATLASTDPTRARAIHTRATQTVTQLTPHFPGDPDSGTLDAEGPTWDRFADLPEADAPCPVLDPTTGRCDLYAARPLTCRIFGPPVQNENGLGVCELCYVGASEQAILSGEMMLNHDVLEEELNAEMPGEETIIAWALLRDLPMTDDAAA